MFLASAVLDTLGAVYPSIDRDLVRLGGPGAVAAVVVVKPTPGNARHVGPVVCPDYSWITRKQEVGFFGSSERAALMMRCDP